MFYGHPKMANMRDSVRLCYNMKPEEEKNIVPVEKLETRRSFIVQTFIPFMLAGCGMVAAGLLLDRASQWTFLKHMPETLILVPALLGLKGNLEMTLASRLSTMANLGLLDKRNQIVNALISNGELGSLYNN